MAVAVVWNAMVDTVLRLLCWWREMPATGITLVACAAFVSACPLLITAGAFAEVPVLAVNLHWGSSKMLWFAWLPDPAE